MSPETIDGILVQLDVEGEQSLFVLLDAQGSINRLGTGAVNNAERDLFIGRTTEPLFEQLRAKVEMSWLRLQGEYDVPEKAGRSCTLTLLFRNPQGQESGLRFRYGSESQGPPEDICQFVTEAVRLTDPWYGRQKEMAATSKGKRPWWQLW